MITIILIAALVIAVVSLVRDLNYRSLKEFVRELGLEDKVNMKIINLTVLTNQFWETLRNGCHTEQQRLTCERLRKRYMYSRWVAYAMLLLSFILCFFL